MCCSVYCVVDKTNHLMLAKFGHIAAAVPEASRSFWVLINADRMIRAVHSFVLWWLLSTVGFLLGDYSS